MDYFMTCNRFFASEECKTGRPPPGEWAWSHVTMANCLFNHREGVPSATHGYRHHHYTNGTH